MKRFAFAPPALALLGLAACNPGGVAGPSGSLDQAEAEALGEALFGQAMVYGVTSIDPDAPGASSDGPQAIPTPFDFGPVNLDCPLGGEMLVAVNGTVEEFEDGSTQVIFELGQAHSECVLTPPGGPSFTINGNPDVATTVDMTEEADGTVDGSGHYGGNVSWRTGERAGVCTIDLDFVFVGDQQSIASTAQGDVCGLSVDFSVNTQNG